MGDELYDVERRSGMEGRCCVADVESKEESIRGTKWRPVDRRTGGRAKRIRTKGVKQEDISIIGMDRVSEVRGVGDKCGWVRVSVR